MAKVYDHLISIQRINESTEIWEDLYRVHAHINKSASNNATTVEINVSGLTSENIGISSDVSISLWDAKINNTDVYRTEDSDTHAVSSNLADLFKSENIKIYVK